MAAAVSRLAGTGPAACLIVLLLGVAGCGGTSAQTSSETTPATEETVTTTTDEITTTQPEPAAPTMRIVVRNGSSMGGIERVSVERGDKVTLVVTADLSDHVHLHGYDVTADVAPGNRARIVFEATVPGRFEIELEDRKIQIGELEVRP